MKTLSTIIISLLFISSLSSFSQDMKLANISLHAGFSLINRISGSDDVALKT